MLEVSKDGETESDFVVSVFIVNTSDGKAPTARRVLSMSGLSTFTDLTEFFNQAISELKKLPNLPWVPGTNISESPGRKLELE